MSLQVVLQRLRQLDAYPKTLQDFTVKTYGGAAISIVSVTIMTILFLSELNYYFTKEVSQELLVDTTRGQKMRINMDITFPKIACVMLSIDAMDVSGEQQIDIESNILKQRIDLSGQDVKEPQSESLGDSSKDIVDTVIATTLNPDRCESCYGAETGDRRCCNSCEDVRDAYRRKGWAFADIENIEQCKRGGLVDKLRNAANEGCRVYGHLLVNKVGGNFHLAPGKSFQQHHVHVHDMQSFQGMQFNTSHVIKHVSFGEDYPGIINPLDGSSQQSNEASVMYSYYIKIVPTLYSKIDGQTVYSNQFSVTKHVKAVGSGTGEQGLPGAFFIYELSPMMVKYSERHKSFMHFLTGVCAIVGGVFTVAGLIDALIYHSSRAIQKKIELGKVS